MTVLDPSSAPDVLRHRPRLLGLGYRMLGDLHEAEDLVQEAYLRWFQGDRDEVQSPEAWLLTVVSRLAVDRLRRAATARESYVGPWLPEPVATDEADRDVARAQDLSIAMLLMLERLAPEERAAFLLREVFDEPYDRIAEIVGTSEQNARQLAARARRHVEERRPRFETSREQQAELATRFFAAAEDGDLEGLEELLAHDVVFRGDGGGKAPAAPRAIHGRAKVARVLIAGWRALAGFSVTTRRAEVNGQPGALFLDPEGRLISVAILDVAEGQIQGVSAIVNPDKLRHLGPVGDVRALLRERT